MFTYKQTIDAPQYVYDIGATNQRPIMVSQRKSYFQFEFFCTGSTKILGYGSYNVKITKWSNDPTWFIESINDEPVHSFINDLNELLSLDVIPDQMKDDIIFNIDMFRSI